MNLGTQDFWNNTANFYWPEYAGVCRSRLALPEMTTHAISPVKNSNNVAPINAKTLRYICKYPSSLSNKRPSVQKTGGR